MLRELLALHGKAVSYGYRSPLSWVVGLLLALGVLLGTAHAHAQPQPAPRTSPEEAQRLLLLARPFGAFSPAPSMGDGYSFSLEDANGQRTGALNLSFPNPGWDRPRLRSAHYTFSIWNASPDFGVIAPLAHAANAIAAADGGALPETNIRPLKFEGEQMRMATYTALGIALLMAIWRKGNVKLDLRLVHALQAVVHSSIFVYWSAYWPGVSNQLPMILWMIGLAYAADAACCFAKFGSWRLGLSPLPVVFSTNLFVWLDWRGAVLAMVGAFVLKTYVRRGQGHIFNPSVAGLTLNAICTLVFPDLVHFGGLFHTLNIAPNMSEWVFLVSLVPLTLFRLLPVSIGAVLGLLYFTQTTGALRPTLLLMMTLLCTDPATTPRSDLGRLLFGLLVGVSYPLYSRLLHWFGQPDDFAKILSVPLANILAPTFDRITAFASRSLASASLPSVIRRAVPTRPLANAWFVVAWIGLYSFGLHREKPLDFEPALHWTWGTPLVRRDADDVPTCGLNPIFCKPFSFYGEARLWLARKP